MNIYLIRHSEAEPASPLKKDSERVLTESGIKLIKEAIINWRLNNISFDCVFTSPSKRAIQSAEIVTSAYEIKNKFNVDKSLKPGCSAAAIIEIASGIESEDAAFIGHQPDLSYITSQLISSYDVNLKISPATIVKISFKGKVKSGKGKLEMLLPPAIKNG